MSSLSASFGVHSEFGRLNDVIVGQINDFAYPPFCANIRYLTGQKREWLSETGGKAFSLKDHLPGVYEKLQAQIETVCDAFRSRDVTVHRTRTFMDQEKLYLSEVQLGHSQLYPADPVFVVGKHLIEGCIRRPFRRKEVWAIRDSIMPMIEADPTTFHVAMPQAQPDKADLEGTGKGIYLEGGDVIILGKTILVGHGPLTSSQAGGRWLARYLAPFGYRVHHIEITGDYLHLLGVMCLVREGLAMVYRPALGGVLPEPIRDWDTIDLTLNECLTLGTVGMNIDPETHLIDRRLTRIIRELGTHGVNCVQLEIDELADWGGAVRCVTLPISRDA